MSENVEEQVSDVIALCEYAVRHLQPRGGRVTLVGASYGGYLATIVAQRRPDLIKKIALLSVRGSVNANSFIFGHPKVRVLQFHGANDDEISPENARHFTESMLGKGATYPPYGCYHVFDREGHTIWRTDNVATMYGAVARFVETE